MKQYTKSNLTLADSGYSSLQLVAVLIAGISLQGIRSQLVYPEIANCYIGKLSIIFMFVVFCNSLFISGTISAHISSIYSLLSRPGNKNSRKDILEGSIFAKKTEFLMRFCLFLFWITIPLFLIAVSFLIVIRFKLQSSYKEWVIYFTSLVFIVFLLYQKYIHSRIYEMVTKKYTSKR